MLYPYEGMWMRVTGLRTAMVAAAAAVVLATLAGCSPAADTATTPSPATPTRPAPQQKATAVPVDPANLSSWLVTWAGAGPLTIGGDVTAQTSAIPGFEKTDDEDGDDEDGCVGYELETQPANAEPSGTRLAVTAVADDGHATATVRIRAVDASDLDQPVTPTPKTSAGIGLGSTRDALTQAYPDLERSNSLSDGRRAYALGDGSGRWVDFVVNANDVVTELWVTSTARVPSDLCD